MDDRLTVERKAVPWPVGNDKLTVDEFGGFVEERLEPCLLYTSPSPRD